MSGSLFRRMYGSSAVPVQLRPESEEERQKRAVKILGGMKISNSHIKTVRIGEDLIDVPKIEYLHLLEGQVKELRGKLRTVEGKMIRLENNHSRLLSEITALKREILGKVNLR